MSPFYSVMKSVKLGHWERKELRLCVCICVCEGERERDFKIGGLTKAMSKKVTLEHG